jgi:putative SOS response-associated peptidase YedK
VCSGYSTAGEVRGWAETRLTPLLPELFATKSELVRPTHLMPVVVGGARWHVERMKWGLVPRWGIERGMKPMINARAESLFERPYFRDAARRRRALVTATAFYEWVAVPGQKKKKRVAFSRRDGRPLVIAALWEPGPEFPTYTLVTTDASAPVRAIHDRQPVVLEADALEAWMDGAEREVLRPSADDVLIASDT